MTNDHPTPRHRDVGPSRALTLQLMAADLPLTCLELHRELQATGRRPDPLLLSFAAAKAGGLPTKVPGSAAATELSEAAEDVPVVAADDEAGPAPQLVTSSSDVLPHLVAEYLDAQGMVDAAEELRAKLLRPLDASRAKGCDGSSSASEEPRRMGSQAVGCTLADFVAPAFASVPVDSPAGPPTVSPMATPRGGGGSNASFGATSYHHPHSGSGGGGVWSDNAALVERCATAEARHLSVIRTLGERLPTVMESIHSDRKECVVPVILAALQYHPQAAVRRSLIYHLLHLYRRPSAEQRLTLLRAMQSAAELVAGKATSSTAAGATNRGKVSVGPTTAASVGGGSPMLAVSIARTSEETVPEVLQLVGHRYNEMRCVAAGSLPYLDPYITDAVRAIFLANVLVPLSTDSSSTVRAQVATALPFCWASGGISTDDAVQVFLRLVLDPKPPVVAAAEHVVPRVLGHALERKTLFRVLVPALVAALIRAEGVSIVSTGRGDRGEAAQPASWTNSNHQDHPGGGISSSSADLDAMASGSRTSDGDACDAHVRVLSDLLHRCMRTAVAAATAANSRLRQVSAGTSPTPAADYPNMSAVTPVRTQDTLSSPSSPTTASGGGYGAASPNPSPTAQVALSEFSDFGLPALWQAGLQASSDRVRDAIAGCLGIAAVGFGAQVCTTLDVAFKAALSGLKPQDTAGKRRALRLALVVLAQVPDLTPVLARLIRQVADGESPWIEAGDSATAAAALSRVLSTSGGSTSSAVCGVLHLVATEVPTEAGVRFVLRVLSQSASSLRDGGSAVGIVWPLLSAVLADRRWAIDFFAEVAEAALLLTGESTLGGLGDALLPMLFSRVDDEGPTSPASGAVLSALAGSVRRMPTQVREKHVLPHLSRLCAHVAGSQPTAVTDRTQFLQAKGLTIRGLLAVFSALVTCPSIGFHSVSQTLLPALRALAKDVEAEPVDVRVLYASLVKSFAATEAKGRPRQNMSFLDKMKQELSSIGIGKN